jgi:hypothetical protein
MLWDLLTALCFAMPVAGALAAVKGTQKGWAAYALAIVIGVVTGGCCAWAMRTVGVIVEARSRQRPDPQGEWYFRALYLAAAAWIFVALFLGARVTGAFIHFI